MREPMNRSIAREGKDMNEEREAMRQMRRAIGPSYSLQEIGEHFGVTREWVRQVTRGVSPGREVEQAIAHAARLYCPIEVEIVNPYGVREQCQACTRPAKWASPQGPVCNNCQTKILYRHDPEFRVKHREQIKRYSSGPCPRPGPECKDWYQDVWQHLRTHSAHAEDYEELYAKLREERGLPPRTAPPRKGW